jgi:hypothetical protein
MGHKRTAALLIIVPKEVRPRNSAAAEARRARAARLAVGDQRVHLRALHRKRARRP